MVTETIIYQLNKGMEDVYWNAFIEESLPAMEKWKIKVLNYGFSLEDPSVFHLIRSFNSLQQRNEILGAFYASQDWQEGPRTQIISSIASSKTTIYES